VATGAMLFLPVGTCKFWQGGKFLGLLLIPTALASILFTQALARIGRCGFCADHSCDRVANSKGRKISAAGMGWLS